MEQPLRRNQFDMNESLSADAGKIEGHGDVPRKAGHILLHETPHDGEISLHDAVDQPIDPTKQVARTEVPAWYNVKFNAMDQVVEQEYGQAFKQEQQPERVGDQGASAALAALRRAASRPLVTPPVQDDTIPPHAAPVAPVPQISDTPLTANNPIYNAMTHPIQTAQPKPIGQPETQPVPAPPVDVPAPAQVAEQPTMPTQPLPTMPERTFAAAQPTMPQEPFVGQTPEQPSVQPPLPHMPQPATMTGAVNPSSMQPIPQQPALPTAPQYTDPRLPEGSPKRVDPQHLLPAARKHAARYLQNPWVWLAVGLLMILYFIRSL